MIWGYIDLWRKRCLQMASDKTVISARVPNEILEKLKAQSEKTGEKLTDVVVLALGVYVGIEQPQSWGERLAALEEEVAGLIKKSIG